MHPPVESFFHLGVFVEAGGVFAVHVLKGEHEVGTAGVDFRHQVADVCGPVEFVVFPIGLGEAAGAELALDGVELAEEEFAVEAGFFFLFLKYGAPCPHGGEPFAAALFADTHGAKGFERLGLKVQLQCSRRQAVEAEEADAEVEGGLAGDLVLGGDAVEFGAVVGDDSGAAQDGDVFADVGGRNV